MNDEILTRLVELEEDLEWVFADLRQQLEALEERITHLEAAYE